MKKFKKVLILLLILCIIVICVFKIYFVVLKRLYPKDYAEYVYKYSKEYDVDANWIFALIKTESNFKKDSISGSGAIRTYATYGKNSRRSCRRYWT